MVRRAHAAAVALLALAALPAPRCVQPGVREASAPCVRAGVTKEARKAYPDIGATLAVLKHVLAKDALWPEGQGHVGKKERKNILVILEDPDLVIEYSEEHVAKEHLRGKNATGGQTIDENTIRLSAAGGKTRYELAQTLLHELMHVQQLRYEGKPNGGPREWLTAATWENPAYKIEEDLPMAPFVQVPKDVECLPSE